jgi:hypothetical protein
MISVEKPLLSVVVAIVSDTTGRTDTTHLQTCLDSLRNQSAGPPMEIIVPYHPSVSGIHEMRRLYPDVLFHQVDDLRTYTGHSGSREHHDELRAQGLALARGSIVALIEDHGVAAADWSKQIVQAHRNPAAAFGGAIENGIDKPLNWAVFFCDFLRYQNPLSAGESELASDANVSYKRDALVLIRPVWTQIFHEWSVNQALRTRGERVHLAPGIVVHQHRQGLTLRSALAERFVWGRSYAGTRTKLAGSAKRMFWLAFSPALPVLMLLRMLAMAIRKRRTAWLFVKTLPLTSLLIVSWCCGEFAGYATGRANRDGAVAGEALARGSAAAS